jgi:GTP pyrophosphokinase
MNLFYDPDRRIDVVWDSKSDNTQFTVCLTIEVEDRRGMLADVTSCISDTEINIRKIETSTKEDEHAYISVTMDIDDLKHLQRVIKVLRAVSGVRDVERVLRQR